MSYWLGDKAGSCTCSTASHLNCFVDDNSLLVKYMKFCYMHGFIHVYNCHFILVHLHMKTACRTAAVKITPNNSAIKS